MRSKAFLTSSLRIILPMEPFVAFKEWIVSWTIMTLSMVLRLGMKLVWQGLIKKSRKGRIRLTMILTIIL